ncbi:MAG TPA: Lrp/AsnC family transcriptional regulator [Gordonia sp. (in: high G+C Gram-positive bacteria)]|jgi:DNA-binding Lrp family transcriptional regulator|uniref:Lrp/AsnC family transcriptional regulator n=1 Tax=unclassified Gordonia (in: high G+C Gram-positive bacteria) TaxID=2657482 RepID=UPI0025B83677|nr:MULTISPECIES: Lrp/AsnC family transcriptional regulator [unclassified Gordonia (in: high G+C Gram-positive bacteria)]HNP56293.1 Lrp/AsnC family transcriptional regulator [Gordonia sp. (in: high G+C Gram-positive bacteria)]HRC51189.1 Lrp/AsnC family transcriptional regulator [Gordonia sp. (in: high G+C Gram-positive bacteria)]
MIPALDDLDRQLISLLRANGRESVVNLAKRLGVTRATVNARLDRLVENGVIVGFSVRVRDPADASVVRAIMLIAVEGRSTPEVIRNLRGVPEIAALHTTNGEWDLIAEMNCESLAAFDHALGVIRGIGGIHHSETSILLSSATA